MLPASIRRLRPDVFVMALAGTVTVATLLPCQGTSARIFHAFGLIAIATLFFLQGARLSREAILAGMTNWKLHATIAGTTFALFPLLGTALIALMPHALDRSLVLGVLFLCALPSTVQSSIALTSIARGNVAGAVCAATASSLMGMVFTPLLFGFMSHVRGGGVDVSGMWQVFAAAAAAIRCRPSAASVDRPVGGAKQVSAGDHRPWLDPDRGLHRVQCGSGARHLAPGPADDAGRVGGDRRGAAGRRPADRRIAARAFGFAHADEVAAVFCGSQKSLVAGIPIASALFAGPTLGVVVLPIMIYHPLQLVVCAWLARRFANRPIAAAASSRCRCRVRQEIAACRLAARSAPLCARTFGEVTDAQQAFRQSREWHVLRRSGGNGAAAIAGRPRQGRHRAGLSRLP